MKQKILAFLVIGMISVWLLKSRVPSMVQWITHKKPPVLKTLIAAALKNTPGTYGIAVRNMVTGETYGLNEHTSFQTASLYKVWIMALVYQQIQNGTLKEDQMLSADIPALNAEFHIPEEQAEQIAGKVEYSVKDALTKMTVISDNYAALLLAHTIGAEHIMPFLKTHNLKDSAGGQLDDLPTTSPADMVHFFQLLYEGKLANPQLTSEMIEFLSQEQISELLSKQLPKTVKIAHKTGALELLLHDAGIIYAPSGTYTVAILSQTPYPPDTEIKIGQLSRVIYDYFQEQKEISDITLRVQQSLNTIFAVLALFFFLTLARSSKPQ